MNDTHKPEWEERFDRFFLDEMGKDKYGDSFSEERRVAKLFLSQEIQRAREEGAVNPGERRRIIEMLRSEVTQEEIQRAKESERTLTIYAWNKAQQQNDGTTQGLINCMEEFRNFLDASPDSKTSEV